MKNLLIYINPNKQFDEEAARLAEIQIENSLDLGWPLDDMLLVTNFEYEHMGVKASVIDDSSYHIASPNSSKTPTIVRMLELGMVEDDEVYWVHDFDAYQNIAFDEPDIGDCDMALCTYGYKRDWQCGSVFFKKGAEDIYRVLCKAMHRRPRPRAEEKTFLKLTDRGYIDTDRIKTLNVTYNINIRDVGYNCAKATKPLKVLHFRPYYHDHLLPDTLLNTFMYGKNKFGVPLMSERLIKIFHDHGIK